jgi:hypothetical protein
MTVLALILSIMAVVISIWNAHMIYNLQHLAGSVYDLFEQLPEKTEEIILRGIGELEKRVIKLEKLTHLLKAFKKNKWD